MSLLFCLALLAASEMTQPEPASAQLRVGHHGRSLQGASDLMLMPCMPRDYSTLLSFANALLVRSNLGGRGGRCSDATRCVEPLTPTTPHEIYFANLGRTRTGERIDLRIVNQSECA